jgi:endonuclease YncB( thermonuclease family)
LLASVPAPFLFNATVVNVHDGDTINVIVDLGFRRYVGSVEHPQPVRLLGGAARELDEPGGAEAGDNVAKLLPAGTPVVLVTAKDDKFAPRWLARVLYLHNGEVRDLVADLISDSWLAPWDGRGKQPAPPWPRPASF